MSIQVKQVTNSRSSNLIQLKAMAIAIVTPTGNVGQQVTQLLAAEADLLILLARHPEKLSDAIRQQAKVFQGSLTDTAFVVEATQAAEALFWVSPINFNVANTKVWYADLTRAVTTAVQTHHIPYVVNLSSVGAHLPTGLGPISQLHSIEQNLNQVATNIIHLRPNFFMENYYYQLEALQNASVFFPFSSKQRMPMVATRDIAAVAANLLLNRTWQGHSIIGLNGVDISFEEAATILSQVLGQSIKHVQITFEQFHEAMLKQGASFDVATQYTQMWRGLTAPDFTPVPPTLETTPTTFAEFANAALKPLQR